MTSELAEARRANALKEREVKALEQLAEAQGMLANVAMAAANAGTAWQKFLWGGDGGAGARSRHMRVNY